MKNSLLTDETLDHALATAGLSDNDQAVYRALLAAPRASAREIMKRTDLSRTMVYYVLGRLESDGLVRALKTGSKTLYETQPPEALQELITKQEDALHERKMSLDAMLPHIRSLYNLAHNKPGVRFFEGWGQVGEALYATLPQNKDAKEIYAFVDLEDIDPEINTINKRYVAERRKRGINKKLLLADTPHNRTYMRNQGSQLTEVRFLPPEVHPFRFGMEIHDGKITYISIRSESPIAIAISDPHIYQMHRDLFLLLWNTFAKK